MNAPTPPSTPLLALTDRCVQCGLCLPTCPTYGLSRLESESPRGRIALVRAWESGVAMPTTAGEAHLDHCLGCRRCEAVCPAGVEYGRILTLARTRQRLRRKPGTRQRFAERLATHAGLRRALFGLYRQLFPVLPPSLRPLPRPQLRPPHAPEPTAVADDVGGFSAIPDRTVMVFVGCIAESYEGPTRAALVRLLAAIGVRAEFPATQGCCGALHAHAGDTESAESLAAGNRIAFAGNRPVLTLASGCHAAMAETLGTRVVDAFAFLAERADNLRFFAHQERIALHLPCTQRNVVRSDKALYSLLARVPGVDIIPLDPDTGCCGAAGTQMLTDPVRAGQFRQPFLDALLASGATRLLSANIGCRLHLANAATVPVQHPLDFLAGRLA